MTEDRIVYRVFLESQVLDSETGDWIYNDSSEILRSQDLEEIRSYFRKIDPEESYNYYLEIFSGDPEDWRSDRLETIGGEDYKNDPSLL